MQTTNFHPELGEATPNVDGYLKPCFHANKIRVWTKLELSGRGVTHERTLAASDLTDFAQQWVEAFGNTQSLVSLPRNSI